MFGRGSRTASGSRGQSEVLSVVLLLAVTIAGTGLVVAFGSTALDDSKRSSEIDSAEHAMTQLDSKLSLVGLGGATAQTVSLGVDAPTRVEADRGWMRLRIVNRTDDTVESEVMNRTLGAVVYRNGGTTVAYQGGGVWRRTDAGSAMVSPPEFHYRGTTLTLPLVTVEGSGRLGGDVRASKRGATVSEFPDGTDSERSNPLANGTVNVTVSSAYYNAWGRFFEERTGGEVSYDHDRGRVTITMVVPGESTNVTNALAGTTADQMTIKGAGGSSFTDSYNSSEDPYSGGPTPPYEGMIITKGSVELTGGAEIYGDLRTDDSVTIGGGVTVHGNVSHDGASPCKGGGPPGGGGGNGNGNGGGGGDAESCPSVEGWVADNGSAPDIEPIGALVESRAATYAAAENNDNDEVSAIDEATNTWNDAESTLQLPTGGYYLASDDLDSSETLEFDTSEGDVVLVVDDDITWGGVDVEVTDPDAGTVRIYTTGSQFHVTDDATVGDLDGHRSPSLRVYAEPGLETRVAEDADFVGLVYAPGTPAKTGSVTVRSQGELYGGVVGGGPVLLQSGGSIHFDEALRRVDPVDGEGDDIPRLTYLHVSVSEVEVEDA